MTASRKKREEVHNENWEAEIAAYDAECRARDTEFDKTHLVVKDYSRSDLTVEENEVFDLILTGVSCSEIAKKYEVEVEVITGLLEIILAELSLLDT